MSRIGIFGGTFDPIHVGHLILAEWMREQFALDRVLFIPAAVSPHKLGRSRTEAKLRFEMVELAIAGNEAFEVSDMELTRAGVSFTVDTLTELKQKRPEANLFFLIGADSLVDLPRWRACDEIVRLAQICVARRPGLESLDFAALEPHLDKNAIEGIRRHVVDAPLIGLSSTLIRQRVAAGLSIRYLVPSAVAAYIHERKLYLTPESQDV